MSASLSSRRIVSHGIRLTTPAPAAMSVIAFVLGAIVMAIAVKQASPVLAIPGFVGLAGSLAYWNTAFWNAVYSLRRR